MLQKAASGRAEEKIVLSHPVVHFEIGGADGARSRTFYSELFGWSVSTEAHGYGVVSTGSADGIGRSIIQAPRCRPG